MTNYPSFFLFLIGLLICACQPDKEYNTESCNLLSMKSFKGLPKEALEFKENCKNIAITYTKERCQKALTDLMLSGNQKYIEKTYGPKIFNCFTENDLKKFLGKN